MVFQLQFTLFKAAQLQLVGVAVADQHFYDSVEVAMFHVKFNDAALDVLFVSHVVLFHRVLLQNVAGRGHKPPPGAYNRSAGARLKSYGLQH
jgi:hypothetical protein